MPVVQQQPSEECVISIDRLVLWFMAGVLVAHVWFGAGR